MNLSKLFLTVVTSIAVVIGLVLPESRPKQENPIPHLERIFARKLYQRVSLESGGGNLVVCPLSVHVLLASLLEGSAGTTRSQLIHLLELDDGTGLLHDNFRDGYKNFLKSTLSKHSIQMITKLFLEKSFAVNADFKSISNEYYHTGMEIDDFKNKEETVLNINKYVMDQTNNTIRNIISEGDLIPGTCMICIATLHFKDSWALPFSMDTSSIQYFRYSNSTQKHVDMMHLKNKLHFIWDGSFQAKILSLDFTTKGFSMVFLLPDRVDGLSDLEASLADIDYIPLFRLVQSTPPVSVEVWMPPFRIEGDFDFGHILQEMGPQNLFSPSADLSGISCCGGLHVSSIKQKTHIVVEEHGVEASSADAVVLGNGLDKGPSQEFRADHPFLFFLLMNETVVFQGRLVQP